jgi:mono/diheme cytochrome c family protein
MKHNLFTTVIMLSAIVISATILAPLALSAEKDQVPDGTKLVKGGLLYDNWPKVVGAKPEGNHPLYPTDAKKSGSSTWRCKECHGWDYIGAKGRYSKGSHYTGIKGISGAASQTEEQLVGALSGKVPDHNFAKYLSEEDRQALALFIQQGQVDWKSGIDLTDGAGDIKAGKESYEKACEECHGTDGNAIDFKKKKDGTQGVGWLAKDNPQETLHKLRWGHPGSDMGSAVIDGNLDTTATINILRYSLTLP